MVSNLQLMGKKRKSFIIILTCLVFATLGFGQTSITHGHQKLLDREMQFNALAYYPNRINTYAWDESGFTTCNIADNHYYWMTHPALAGLPYGTPFKRVLKELDGTPEEYTAVADEYLPYLVSVQWKDEQSISSSQLSTLASDIANLKGDYPDAMVYCNNKVGSSGFNVSDFSQTTLNNYTQTVKPDMLHFSEYPFRWQGTNYPARDYEGGSPTGMYVHMEMYRKAGIAGLDGTGSQPIPVGMYVQTFADDGLNNRLPTESEYRLQQFAGLAFGMKSFDTFLYCQNAENVLAGSSSTYEDLFFTYTSAWADPTPKPEFYNYAAMLGEAKNIAPSLVRLISTDVRMKMGRREDGVTNPLPADSFSEVAVAAWDSTADAYLKNVSATNLGTKNNGMEGDVIVGFFKPLDSSLAQPGAENDPYFMIVNGLSDETGNAVDCRQQIHMEFDFADSGINQLLRRSRETGAIEQVSLTHDSGSLYYLDLVLDGGTGDLFKYDNGFDFIIEPQTPAVHYTFKETAPGTWEVLVDVTGDTAGLSAYEIWVDGVEPTTVTYVENNLGSGFASLLAGDVGGSFNAGNYQGISVAIEGIGMVAIDEDGVILDAQALLGILSTEAGLTEENFRVRNVGLLNAAGDGFYDARDLIATCEVIPFVFLLGDANGDGVVSAGDYASVQANFGNTGDAGGGLVGDANGDGVVSAGDYAAVQANFGNTSTLGVVPEPVTMSLLAIGGIALLRRKRTSQA